MRCIISYNHFSIQVQKIELLTWDQSFKKKYELSEKGFQIQNFESSYKKRTNDNRLFKRTLYFI